MFGLLSDVPKEWIRRPFRCGCCSPEGRTEGGLRSSALDTTLQLVPVYPTPDGAAPLANWEHDIYEKSEAPAFMYEMIKANPHGIVLLGLGNMTNIATLFNTYPDATAYLFIGKNYIYMYITCIRMKGYDKMRAY